MIIFLILKYFLLFLFILLLFLLLVPIDYCISASKYDTIKFQGGISWLWRGIQVDFANIDFVSTKVIFKVLGIPFTHTIDQKQEKEKVKEKKKKEKKSSGSKLKGKAEDWLKLISQETFSVILNTVIRLWYYIKPKTLVLKARYGFDNPYDTAMVLAVYSSLYPLLRDYAITLTPSFEGAELEGETQIQGRIVLVLLVFILIKLLLSKPIRNIINFLRKKKKEEKIYVN